MASTDIPLNDARAIWRLVTTKEASPTEVVALALERAEEVDSALNVFVNLTPELAFEAAKRVERALLRGEPVGPLSGVPVTVKDNLNVAGIPTSSGSRILASNIAAADSPAVARAIAAGACIIGKTTLPEFATKGVGDSPLTGITRNPWNPQKTTGGSSAGGAAAVAAGVAPLAITTDGGGSSRLPAAFCGVFGLKPQHGRVPYFPISATPSLSHVGIISNTVQDSSIMLSAISGVDFRDPSSMPCRPWSAVNPSNVGITGLRVAWCPGFGASTPEPQVLMACEAAVKVFTDELGCSVYEIAAEFPDAETIWESEFLAGAGAKLNDLVDLHSDVMDAAVVAQMLRAREQSLETYFRQVSKRYEYREVIRDLFEDYDLLITPTLPCTAFDTGIDIPPGYEQRYDGDVLGWVKYLAPFNVTGNPAANVPCGLDSGGLPIGLQLVGPSYDENVVLRAASAFERARPWSVLRPSLGK